jgi:hypothetical protein
MVHNPVIKHPPKRKYMEYFLSTGHEYAIEVTILSTGGLGSPLEILLRSPWRKLLSRAPIPDSPVLLVD